QTAAGTARYVSSLERSADVELVRLRQGGSGRAATVYRDAVWYPLGLPRLARSAPIDLLHCPTFRGPLGPPASPLLVTVHGPAVRVRSRRGRAGTAAFAPRASCGQRRV